MLINGISAASEKVFGRKREMIMPEAYLRDIKG